MTARTHNPFLCITLFLSELPETDKIPHMQKDVQKRPSFLCVGEQSDRECVPLSVVRVPGALVQVFLLHQRQVFVRHHREECVSLELHSNEFSPQQFLTCLPLFSVCLSVCLSRSSKDFRVIEIPVEVKSLLRPEEISKLSDARTPLMTVQYPS